MPISHEKFIQQVLESIRASETHGLLNAGSSDVLDGLSGIKSVGLLQRLTGLFQDEADTCYLEIGVFQGLTLLSVASAFPDYPCFGIDNFSLLDPEGKNLDIVRDRTAKLEAQNAELINLDFEEALIRLDDFIGERKVSVFLIDGAHDYRSQMMCLLLGKKHLHERAIILVDDANYNFVRQSTHDFLKSHSDYKMIFDAYSPMHPANMDPATLTEWEKGWLNGVNILVCDPEGCVPEMLPPVEENRQLYVNEWLVHRHQFAELAPQAIDLAQSICMGDNEGEGERRRRLMDAYAGQSEQLATRFPDRNTYSGNLPALRYNKTL
jgi:hypothetical protein